MLYRIVSYIILLYLHVLVILCMYLLVLYAIDIVTVGRNKGHLCVVF